MISRGSLSRIAVLLGLALTVLLEARTPTLVLKHADSNRNTMSNGKLRSVLKGNVKFEYDEITVNADDALWYRSDGIARFFGNILVETDSASLKCDKMDYRRDRKHLIAGGGVDFFDETKQVRITGGRGVYLIDTRHLTLDKEPKLYRYDIGASDTLIVLGKQIVYDDSLGCATVSRDVEIYKGLLEAECQLLKYFIDDDRAELRTDPRIYYDMHDLVGDSVDLFFLEESLTGVAVMRNGVGVHRDTRVEDTVITVVNGDSLFISISDSGWIDTLWSYGKALTYYFAASKPDLKNEARGRAMTLDFASSGNARALSIVGNAECSYYLEEEDARNEASGDQISVRFHRGKAAFLKLTGDARGTYFGCTAQ